jgi:hypothetical protein
LAWYYNTYRLAMVWMEDFAVHLVGHHDTSVGIQTPVQLDGSTVVSIWKLVCSLEADISCSTLWLCGSKQISDRDSGPQSCGQTSCAPREALRLPDHVLFLSTIAGTYEGDRVGCLFIVVDEVSHAHLDGVFNKTFDSELPVINVIVLALWYSAMVADVVEILTCEEAFVIKVAQWSFNIERVDAG